MPLSRSWWAWAIRGTSARVAVQGILLRKLKVWVTWLLISSRSSLERLPLGMRRAAMSMGSRIRVRSPSK